MLRTLRFFPAMALPPLAYAMLVLSGLAGNMSQQLFAINMASGETWSVTYSAVFLTFALVCFFAELLRTASPSTVSTWVNVLLACAFAPCMIAFLLVRGFATDEFFLVTLMMLLDFLLDSAVLVFTSRRTVEVSRNN